MSASAAAEPTILFVTGRLAEASLREMVTRLSRQVGFQFEIAVPGIQVAALLDAELLRRRLHVGEHIDRVILPGWCQGSLEQLTAHFGRPFERGPRDLRDLPEYFGLGRPPAPPLDQYSIQIIAEINHATQQPLQDVLQQAVSLAASGADMIDVGCVPGESSPRVAEIVRALRAEGLSTSIDSFDRAEVEAAVEAGAELVLSCNSSNVDWVSRLGTEVVVIPDTPADLSSLDRLIARLAADSVAFRVDPVLEPIGMGFTPSLERYLDVRRRYSQVPMLMGIGNLTELTEVDSAGVNLVLAAVCEDLQIGSVLTTQVINWCRTAVQEFHVARRLVHHAVAQRVIAKHLTSDLVMLRDPRWTGRSSESLNSLAAALTDANFRIFAEQQELHLMNRHGHWHGSSPFSVFAAAMRSQPQPIDPSHAFYLGYELARAELAIHLGKQYEQDEPMRWGLLGPLNASSTVAHHRAAEAISPTGPARGVAPDQSRPDASK